MSALRAVCCAVLLAVSAALAPQAAAGATCEQKPVGPYALADASATALRVAEALDAQDAPVALIARVGQDLSKHGLVYSHAGFAVRDHADGRWTVVHLLNTCGSEDSGLYAQGLVNFFADDLIAQHARIVWLEPALAEALANRLKALPRNALFTPKYNLIARPGSREYQNSTLWVVEQLAAALLEAEGGSVAVRDRNTAYRRAVADGFVPDRIQISYGKRIVGGLFGANIAFTDHPVSTRLSGDYPVATVRAILQWLERSGHAQEQREWRYGKVQAKVGPG